VTHHPIDQIEAFALGDLDPAAGNSVLEHADACPTCAILLAEAMSGVAVLAASDAERQQPGAPKVTSLSSRRAGNRPLAWWTGAAAAAAVVLGVWNVELRRSQPVLPIASLVHSHFQHHALVSLPSAGSAKVILALDGSWLYALGDGLERNAGYQLWETRSPSGAPAEVGEFQSDAAGDAAAYWRQPPGPVTALWIVREGRRVAHWP
jgi:hypothetical protein